GMRELLFAWIGGADLRAAAGDAETGLGPIACAATSRRVDEIVLLSAHDQEATDRFIAWLSDPTSARLGLGRDPVIARDEYRDIPAAAVAGVLGARERCGRNAKLTFHLSPGAPAMAATWILLANTRFPAELIESSKARGVWTTAVAFDLSADLLVDLLHHAD